MEKLTCKEFTYKGFNNTETKIIDECIELLNNYGDFELLPDKVEFVKFKSVCKFGDCTTYEKGKHVRIRLHRNLMQNKDKFINTTIHELIHSFRNVKHGHGADWKRYAEKYSQVISMPIERCSNSRELGITLDERKAARTIKCPSCGLVHEFKRNNNKIWFCKKCNVKMVDVK